MTGEGLYENNPNVEAADAHKINNNENIYLLFLYIHSYRSI